MTNTEKAPDYNGFGASVSGALDVYVASSHTSPDQLISQLLDIAGRYGITIGEDL